MNMTLLEQLNLSENRTLELVTYAPSITHELGIVATMGLELNHELFAQARQLRADVYIDEKGFLSEESRQEDGGESDKDDDRSVQFAVTETFHGEDEPISQVIGTSRLVVKREKDDILPAEILFQDIPVAPVGSVEASRYIARHADKSIQRLASVALIMGMVNEATTREAGYIYAVVERPLKINFNWLGIPLHELTELRFLEEYNTENMAIKFDPDEVLAGIEAKRPELFHLVKESVSGL
jgi:N-acyl-L-homoserine lactone synthetase